MVSNTRWLFAGVVLASAASANAVIIDDFTQGQYSITANSIMPNAEAVRAGATSSIAGGERDALLQYNSGPLSVSAIVNGGAAQFFSAESQTAGTFTLQYDGLDGEVEDGVLNNGSNLGMDLTSEESFEFNFRFLDAGLDSSLGLLTTVHTASGSDSFFSAVANGTNITHIVNFSEFQNVDFSNVQRVEFQFTNGAATDFTLTSIRTRGDGSGGGNVIPGPAALIPFLAGLASMRRRRRSRI